MRRLVLAAVLLAPAPGYGQEMTLVLPAWCTETYLEPATTLVTVRATASADDVDIDGIPLARRDGEFVGTIDLMRYLAPRRIGDPVGDVELVAVARRRDEVVAAKAVCRVGRTAFELVEARLPELAGRRPIEWAAPFAGDKPHPAVVIREREAAWRAALPRVSFVWSTWDVNDPLGALQLIALVRAQRRVLEICPRCEIDATATPNEKRPCRRAQEVAEVRVLAARTGRPLVTRLLSAPPPPPCRLDMTFAEAESRIRDADIETWLGDLGP